jgi:hypothetical protein
MEKKVFIIDNQEDFIQYLKYLQDKSLDGFSFEIYCNPIRGIDGKVKGEFLVSTYKKEGWKYIDIEKE